MSAAPASAAFASLDTVVTTSAPAHFASSIAAWPTAPAPPPPPLGGARPGGPPPPPPPRHEHAQVVDRPVGEHAAVGGQRRDAQRRAELEARVRRQRHGLPDRDHGVLGRRAPLALPGR